MNMSLSWDNEDKTVVYWLFEDAWTWQDFEEAQSRLHDMLHTVDHMVDVIADMRAAPSLPPDTFRHFKHAELIAQPNRRRVILVGGSLLVRAMATTFNQVFRNRPTRFELADSVEDAHAMLREPVR